MLDNTILSIGYGNRQISDFIALLHLNGITTIVDIRSNPFSRFQPNYNKNKLQAILYENGISYVFKGDELGGKPQNHMLYKNGKLNYKLVNATKQYQETIAELIEAASIGEKICLMCCELNPDNCHRKTLIAETLLKIGIAVNHITANGTIEIHESNNPLSLLF
jgi:uncharacterized protein (DUF488 family)